MDSFKEQPKNGCGVEQIAVKMMMNIACGHCLEFLGTVTLGDDLNDTVFVHSEITEPAAVRDFAVAKAA